MAVCGHRLAGALGAQGAIAAGRVISTMLPLQVADLRRPQAMAVGDQDHGRVAMPVATMLASAVHQPLDLALGEVAPLDCQVYDAWGAFPGSRFHADKPCLRVSYCAGYTHLLNSLPSSDDLSMTGMAVSKGSCSGAARQPWKIKTGDFQQVVGAAARGGPTPLFGF